MSGAFPGLLDDSWISHLYPPKMLLFLTFFPVVTYTVFLDIPCAISTKKAKRDEKTSCDSQTGWAPN